MNITVKNNGDLVGHELEEAILCALERCRMKAEGYAVKLVPTDTSALKQSLTHLVDPAEPAAYIGTNNEYGGYVELGTGIYAEKVGKPGWWVYVKGGDSSGKSKGKRYTREEAARIVAIMRDKGLDAHMTEGQKPMSRSYSKRNAFHGEMHFLFLQEGSDSLAKHCAKPNTEKEKAFGINTYYITTGGSGCAGDKWPQLPNKIKEQGRCVV